MFKQFSQGDAVYYVGSKFKQDLTNKEGRPMRGWIHANVSGKPQSYVVFFPEAKDSDYVLHETLLTRAAPPKVAPKDAGPDIMPRRRKATEED